ncbi:response regulator [Dyella flava]|uniref:Response regulator transcription factor n=1 Tax=Dyella flava TaxID=1920170 RepID=A0ABS2K9P0_9GAMM|nr:response regulator transcription factor [Dyella flava]MBM7127844.1 response regulator transcription factor [Dyella flava]GLQ51447.1 DNA-binding response regulator [Dyella flava]
MDNHIRIALADDHPVIRLGIEATLDDISTVRRIGSAVDSTQLVALLDSQACDILITDYAMPGGQYGDGLELMGFLRERYSELGLIVITSMDKAVLIRSLLACGVDAILSKADDMSHLRSAVQAVHSKRKYYSPRITKLIKAFPSTHSSRLSPREVEVIKLYVSGTTINGIAEKLNRSKQTISTQKVSAMRKLGIESDADLFKYAIELGLTQKPG